MNNGNGGADSTLGTGANLRASLTFADIRRYLLPRRSAMDGASERDGNESRTLSGHSVNEMSLRHRPNLRQVLETEDFSEMSKQIQTTKPLPHDWTFENWPADIYPYNGQKARHVVRQNIDELMRCAALARPGHRIGTDLRRRLREVARLQGGARHR